MLTLQNRQQFDEVLRRVFPLFIQRCFRELNPGTPYEHNYHINAIAHQLERCWLRENKRLIITIQPRSLKSLCTSLAWPAFILGHDPSKRIIVVSYSEGFAKKLGRDFRQIVMSDWYRRIFPGTIAKKASETEFETSRGGGRLAVSIGGSVTGRGANFIIIDDPLKPTEGLWRAVRESVNEYFRTTLLSRLDSPRDGIIVLVMQRLHQEDLAGYLLKQKSWFHLNLPAIATRDELIALGGGRIHQRKMGDVLHAARRNRQELDELKSLSSMIFEAQYQQAPVSEAGNLVRADWFQWYDPGKPPVRSTSTPVIQSWDTAVKGDPRSSFSVCTTWLQQDGNHYLRDVTRVQYVYPDLLDEVLKQYRLHKPDALLIEDKGSGSELIADLRHRHQIRAIEIRPQGDKTTRLGSASLSIQAGSVYLPSEAPWLGNFLNEVLLFPQAEAGADDQVDSLSQYLNWARDTGRKTPFEWEWMY